MRIGLTVVAGSASPAVDVVVDVDPAVPVRALGDALTAAVPGGVADGSTVWAGGGELPAANKTRNSSSLASQYPNLKPFLSELNYAHFETTAPGIPNAEAISSVSTMCR